MVLGVKKIVSILIVCVLGIVQAVYASSLSSSGSMYSTSMYLGSRPSTAYSGGTTQRAAGSMYASGNAMRGGMSVSASRGVYTPATTLQVKGFTTSASSVRGGVMSSTTYSSIGPKCGPRRAPEPTSPPPSPGPGTPGYCDHCHYVWDPDANGGDGGWVCSGCGAGLEEGCQCSTEEGGAGYCWCPLECDWTVMVFMALLAAGYVAMKNGLRISNVRER